MRFNAINYTIWGIPGYFFFTGIGVVVSICGFIILLYEKKYSLQINMKILLGALLCVIVFARLFGCITGVYRDIGMGRKVSLESIKNTGIVFYGGLIGLLTSYSICSKYAKQDFHVMDVLAVVIPLFHAIARVGCFVGGCCFGKECHGNIAIEYVTIEFGEIVAIQRIPIQLIEAVFNFALFIYLLCLFKSNEWKEKNILRKYLLIYSCGRFIIEFFRGDLVRGVIVGISFSQVVSIIIWIYLALTKKRKALKEELVV